MPPTAPLPASTSGLSSRQLLSSQSEPICLSDSLDEDLTAPSLDSISYALAPLSNTAKGQGLSDSPLSPPHLQMATSSPPPVTPHYPSASPSSSSVQQHSLATAEAAQPGAASGASSCAASSASASSSLPPLLGSGAHVQPAGLSLLPRSVNGPYTPVKAPATVGKSQTPRLVAMASPSHRPASVISVGGKTQPHPSPSPPRQRPPPTASPLLPPHQKGFSNPVGLLGCLGVHQGLSKSAAKASSITSSSASSLQSRTNTSSHPSLHSFCPPSPVTSSPSPTSHTSHPPQSKSHSQQQQSSFITPMQATLTKSPHSNSSSPIIKLTPRPPAPNPPPASSPSSSSSPSQQLSSQLIANQPQQHQYAAKTFRMPYGVSASAQLKQTAGGCSFGGGQKPPTSTSNNSTVNSSSKGALPAICSPPDKTLPSSVASVSANHGQRQRVVGGVNQGSKTGNDWAASGTLTTSSTTSHLSQVRS